MITHNTRTMRLAIVDFPKHITTLGLVLIRFDRASGLSLCRRLIFIFIICTRFCFHANAQSMFEKKLRYKTLCSNQGGSLSRGSQKGRRVRSMFTHRDIDIPLEGKRLQGRTQEQKGHPNPWSNHCTLSAIFQITEKYQIDKRASFGTSAYNKSYLSSRFMPIGAKNVVRVRKMTIAVRVQYSQTIPPLTNVSRLYLSCHSQNTRIRDLNMCSLRAPENTSRYWQVSEKHRSRVKRLCMRTRKLRWTRFSVQS